MTRAMEKRLARLAAPAVAHRQALRACAAIGAARAAIAPPGPLDPNVIGWTRWSILRLGEDAAAKLNALPDTAELQALDRAFVAAYPPARGTAPPAIAQRMLQLIERYRRECGLDRPDADPVFAALIDAAGSDAA